MLGGISLQLPNVDRSLQELDGEHWGAPEYPSHLVEESYRLRQIPLGDLSIENMRLLIGQNMSLEWLIPLALTRLQSEPLAEGDFFPGDLLLACLNADSEYWASHPEALAVLNDVVMELETNANFVLEQVLPAWQNIFKG